MNRMRFTCMVAFLIQHVRTSTAYGPILDYCKRSDYEQAWLFKKGLSKCDGLKKRSKHQSGLAVDLYLSDGKRLIWDRKIYGKLHKFWEGMGGCPMLSWDIGHFEV